MVSASDPGQLFGLFPTPLQRRPTVLGSALVSELVQRFAPRASQPNTRSDSLVHTQLVTPKDHSSLQETSRLLMPHVIDFGALLLGERLHWSIKELWINVLEPGGHQTLHNHANSFVSGIVYLSESHASAHTVFVKAPGGSDFVFNNVNARTQLGAYNADKWVSPNPQPGDLLLFPSYLMHEVPTNRGERRISLAFNAIPSRLDAWGYTLSLSR